MKIAGFFTFNYNAKLRKFLSKDAINSNTHKNKCDQGGYAPGNYTGGIILRFHNDLFDCKCLLH